MSGLGIRLYTDEDVDADLARQLNRHGYDALSCSEARNASQGLDDEWQLSYATSQGRAILVHNTRHFMPLAAQWISAGKEHHGIICAPHQLEIGELVLRTARHLDTYTPQDHHNLILHLVP